MTCYRPVGIPNSFSAGLWKGKEKEKGKEKGN